MTRNTLSKLTTGKKILFVIAFGSAFIAFGILIAYAFVG